LSVAQPAPAERHLKLRPSIDTAGPITVTERDRASRARQRTASILWPAGGACAFVSANRCWPSTGRKTATRANKPVRCNVDAPVHWIRGLAAEWLQINRAGASAATGRRKGDVSLITGRSRFLEIKLGGRYLESNPQSNRKLAEQPFEDGPGLRRRTSQCAQTSIANSESPLCVLDVACRPRIACSLAANPLSRTSRRRSSPLSAAPRNAASPAHDTSKWSRQVQQRRRSPREPGPGALVRLLTPCAAETTAKIAARMQRTVSESSRAKCASRPDQT
jgi:hypothetical protein